MNGKRTATQVWQERLRRYDGAGVSVRAFCAREGVSQASFYHWRRRLALQRMPNTPQAKSGFQAIRLTTAVGGLSIDLPGGTRVQVAADHVELARAVVREVALVAREGA